MSLITLVKKNRKYFAALKDGRDCQVIIDEESSALELGEHDLQLEDLSIRSKYGVKLIYKVKSNLTEEFAKGVCFLRHSRYNKELVQCCRDLAGKWDPDEKVWAFPLSVEKEVDLLDSRFNDDIASYDVILKEEATCDSVYLLGYPIAKAEDRDGGAKLCKGVALIDGSILSGGSRKYWSTVVDATIRIELSAALASEVDADKIQKSIK